MHRTSTLILLLQVPVAHGLSWRPEGTVGAGNGRAQARRNPQVRANIVTALNTTLCLIHGERLSISISLAAQDGSVQIRFQIVVSCFKFAHIPNAFFF